jgi:ATP-dependent DNA helicase RecG
MPDILSQSVQFLKSVGPKRAESFSKIGINTIKDLLFYFPSRYLDRSTLLNTIKVLQYIRDGYDGEVTIIGQVILKDSIRYGKKQLFKVKMKDGAGFFECVWFQGIKYFKDIFNEGEFYAVSAKPVLTKYGHLQFVHPDFDKLAEKESKDFMHTGKIIPFYRVPKELRSANLGDFSLRRIINNAVEKYVSDLSETLPAEIITEQKLLGVNTTIKNLHFPESSESLQNAMKRIKFEEFFYLECMVALRKILFKTRETRIPYKVQSEPLKKFLEALPFKLTTAQLKVLSEIRKNLESMRPMNRLLQGDVGSGKTIVAIITMIITIYNGFQAVIMSPTEILADQHYKRISKMLEPFGVKVSLLIGGQKKSERDRILSSIETGESQLIIGTHALIEDNVSYNKLGLVVIDEQHRFGVVQRSKLIRKGFKPDVLVMTATPIPRTLSMTLYGDLDVSYIDEMPMNRKPIKTYLRGESKLEAVYQFIIDKSVLGYQTFLVYPLVEESEKMELKAAEIFYNDLRKNHLKELNIGLIHGRMSWTEKESIMQDFANKKYDVLVSTTVIEVGIDIPDANIIVINDAFRFGLSQLHQLRGRVGRSDKQAYCILITKDEFAVKTNQFRFNFDYLSDEQIEKNKSIIRLNAMLKYTNGFDLAEVDFKLRGPGDIFGTKQSGLPELKFADPVSDYDILLSARDTAFKIIEKDPTLRSENNFVIKKILKENFANNILLSEIA